MIHYIDVSGSVTDEYLVQIAKVVQKNFKQYDRIYTISHKVEELRSSLQYITNHSFEWLLLNSSNRHSGFNIANYLGEIEALKKLDPHSILYTDGITPECNGLFDDIFYVPACPVCLCSCIPHQINGLVNLLDKFNIEGMIRKHIIDSGDAEHSAYLVHQM